MFYYGKIFSCLIEPYFTFFRHIKQINSKLHKVSGSESSQNCLTITGHFLAMNKSLINSEKHVRCQCQNNSPIPFNIWFAKTIFASLVHRMTVWLQSWKYIMFIFITWVPVPFCSLYMLQWLQNRYVHVYICFFSWQIYIFVKLDFHTVFWK